uniref:Uncharacterized protein n=1 Tax=Solanum demissum TaxID=50514 RepID=Q0KIM3_SOLDE|nr:hypothetical protein SDM1_49t00015 [Solanum demissum]
MDCTRVYKELTKVIYKLTTPNWTPISPEVRRPDLEPDAHQKYPSNQSQVTSIRGRNSNRMLYIGI